MFSVIRNHGTESESRNLREEHSSRDENRRWSAVCADRHGSSTSLSMVKGLADVGTHVVDLVQWTAFPDQALDYRKDVANDRRKALAFDDDEDAVPAGNGRAGLSSAPGGDIHDGKFDYYCNNSVHYARCAAFTSRWTFFGTGRRRRAAGMCMKQAFAEAKRAWRSGRARPEKWLPELYIVPAKDSDFRAVAEAVKTKMDALQTAWPGVAMESQGQRDPDRHSRRNIASGMKPISRRSRTSFSNI